MSWTEVYDTGWDESWKSRLGGCGDEVFIGHHVIFTCPEKVFLGSRVRIDPFTLITTGLETGDNVQITAYSMLGGGSQHTIKMGNWTFIGYGSKLFCGSEDYSGRFGPVNEFWGHNKTQHGDIKFSDYSGIASDVIVMPGITLPEGCAIGAKSLVYRDKDLLPYSVYMGNPLRFHKNRDRDAIRYLSQRTDFLKRRK